MLRLLFWIALIAAAVWFWRKFKGQASVPKSSAELEAAPDGPLRPLRRTPAPRPRAEPSTTVVLQPGSS